MAVLQMKVILKLNLPENIGKVIHFKSINRNVYSRGREKIYNFVNRLVHEFPGLVPA